MDTLTVYKDWLSGDEAHWAVYYRSVLATWPNGRIYSHFQNDEWRIARDWKGLASYEAINTILSILGLLTRWQRSTLWWERSVGVSVEGSICVVDDASNTLLSTLRFECQQNIVIASIHESEDVYCDLERFCSIPALLFFLNRSKDRWNWEMLYRKWTILSGFCFDIPDNALDKAKVSLLIIRNGQRRALALKTHGPPWR